MFANAAWREIHCLAERLGKFGFIDFSGVMGIDIKRQRFGHADGIAQLDRAAFGKSGSDDIFGHIA